jgi:hypothetical protein
MKWFTVGVYEGVDEEGNEATDESFSQAFRAYNEHLASIEDRLSPEVRALARITMHDAVPKEVRSTEESLALKFEILELVPELDRRPQDPTHRPRPLDLTYTQWDLGGRFGINGLAALMEWGGTSFQVLNDEIDIARDGRYIHRLLFWPAGELVLLFRGLSIDLGRAFDPPAEGGMARLRFKLRRFWLRL